MPKLLLAALSLLVLSPADYTICVPINNGPITPETPKAPFQRQPDFAAMSAYPRTEFFDGMPPERLRGPAVMTVETGAVDKCGKAAPGYQFEACVRDDTVYLPNPCDYPREKFATLMCHEQAHRNGWGKEHGE